MKIGPLVVAGLLAAYLVLRWRRLQLENRILGVVAVAGLAVYGSGVVHIPSLDKVLRDVGKALGGSLALAPGAPAGVRERARAALEAMGHPADERAERLAPEEFRELAERLAPA